MPSLQKLLFQLKVACKIAHQRYKSSCWSYSHNVILDVYDVEEKNHLKQCAVSNDNRFCALNRDMVVTNMELGSEKYFPGIHNSGWPARAANLMWFQWREIQNWVKTNTSLEFISLRSTPLTLMSFLRELQWPWVKKDNTSQVYTYTGRLRKLFLGS